MKFNRMNNLSDSVDTFEMSVPFDESEKDNLYLSIVKRDIPKWAEQYVHHLDTATTQEVCKCEWLVNPDDLEIRPLCCRTCGHPKERHVNGGACTEPHTIDRECESNCQLYNPRRVRMGDTHPHCPVHTPVGRIMGFFEFVFNKKPELAKTFSKEDQQPRGLINQPEITEEDAKKFIAAFQEKYPQVYGEVRKAVTKPELDQDEHAGIAEHCYRQECVNWVTGASDYCSIECEEMARGILNEDTETN